MFLVNGTFRVAGVPGGDSVRFHPDDPQAFGALGLPVRVNARGGARLRLAGIDFLETCYTPRGSATAWHQPTDLAQAGAVALALALGFDSLQQDANVATGRPVAVAGHVLTWGADLYGRVVGFAFPARRRGTVDLSSVRLDAVGVRESVNWMLLRQGLGYPVAYSRLYPDLRQELAAAAQHAHRQQRGVWPRDATLTGFRLTDRDQLQDDIVVLPKLFRRLADYLDLEGPDSLNLAGFPAYLAARADRLVTVPDGHVTHLDGFVEAERQQVRLTASPEQFIFFER